MTLHVSSPFPPVAALEQWRARYPKFGAALDRGGSPPSALRYLGLSLWQDGAVPEAVEALEAAAGLAPDDAALLADLGALRSFSGRKADALNAFIASLERDPSRIQVWLGVAGLCNEIGDKDAAENAYVAALELEPASVDACTGLGLIYIERGRFEDAVRLLSGAVARGVESGAVHACLGQSLYLIGRFAEARTALAVAAQAFPGEVTIIRRYAGAAFAAAAIESTVEAAIDAYRAAAGAYAEDTLAACRSAFQALCGFGHGEAALRLGEAILAMVPDDPIIPFHLDALRGRAHERASRGYVAACFDRYAENFDRHLVEILHYRLPETLRTLLEAAGRRFPRILDLGCGTGLSAAGLATVGDELVGVDLSARMLEKAKARNLYARLVEDDAIAFLDANGAPFDLIVALEMIIYLGDLSALFAGAARNLRPGGLFAFSFEAGAGRAHALSPCGRFVHNPTYVEGLWSGNFDCLFAQQTTIRLEANRPVAGRLVLLRKK
ncbi:methyltransferase domain-containing protein [Methylosinus sp. Sm6]|uniref:methyltransferase domain-containing protein n=1 Tax=Methylosinus sp. Sm6 TaxID=2866948 RepID=UPI001C998A56|nr:methyltransferase domain-containing protein [Methylosinus sp. Sm6]MBY6241240.1 methyltransferase domain-containing protein [Methylosinus sp. Sm6]